MLAVETLPIDRWHDHDDRATGEDLRARSIAIEVKHETLPANRTRLLAAPVDLLPVLAVDLLGAFVYFFPQFLALRHEMRTTRK